MNLENADRIKSERPRPAYKGEAILWRRSFWWACAIGLALALYNHHAQTVLMQRVETLTYNRDSCYRVMNFQQRKVDVDLEAGRGK